MQRDRETRIDEDKPALIVTYGNTRKKVRPLDRSVIMLGQAAGCDVQLKSADVYPVHALVVQMPRGWRVRDVTGRGATRLNGHTIQDEPLQHGDVIQIGTFSFFLHLPATRHASGSANEARSAFDIGFPDDEDEELADRCESPAMAQDLEHLQHSRENLGRLAWGLRQRLLECRGLLERREYEQQAQQRDFDRLLGELKVRAQQLRQVEAELAALRGSQEASQQQPTPAAAPEETEAERNVRIRATELDLYAGHLRRLRERTGQPPPAVLEMEQLRCRLQQLEESSRAADTAAQREIGRLQTQVNSLKAERDRAQELLTTTQYEQEAWQGERRSVLARQEELQVSLRRLRQELDERTLEAENLERQAGQLHGQLQDQHDFEAELHAYRLELERDRTQLNDEHAELEFRAQELERSRQGWQAQLSRERAEIERLQEELRSEHARGRRDSGLRDRIAHVQKLKEQLSGKRRALQGMPTSQPADGGQ